MSSASQTVYWLNGHFVSKDNAVIAVDDHGVLYGDGVFEGIRFYNGKVFRLQAHLDRLVQSANAIYLSIPYTVLQLQSAIEEAIARFAEAQGYIRLVVTRGVGPLGLDPYACNSPSVFLIVDQISVAKPKAGHAGVRAIIASTRRIAPDALDPRIKTLNYLNHILAKTEARHAGVDEAILLNARGCVAEASAANVFVVKNNLLYTPPVADGALDGITRAVVIEIATASGITIKEQSLTGFDLSAADELFLTGTGAELVPVCELNHRKIATCPGPVFTIIQDLFRQQIAHETA